MDPKETPVTPVDPATPGSVPPVNEDPNTPPAPSQTPATPVAPEPKKFTKRERLEFTQAKIQAELDALDAQDDENRPATIGDIKRLRAEEAKETAIEMASSIENQDERDEVVELLESRIVPSGNADEDLKLARTMVNARKTAMIAEETLRKQNPGSHASAPGAPGYTPDPFVPTPQEAEFMQAYGLSKEQILTARQKEAERNQ